MTVYLYPCNEATGKCTRCDASGPVEDLMPADGERLCPHCYSELYDEDERSSGEREADGADGYADDCYHCAREDGEL